MGEVGLFAFAACGALSAYAVFSRRDFSAWGGFFAVGLFVLVICSVINMFVGSTGAALWLSAGPGPVVRGAPGVATRRLVRAGGHGPGGHRRAGGGVYP